MREIKFRGFWKDVKGNYLSAIGNLSIVDNKEHSGWFISNTYGSPFAYRVIPSTVGQFTGFKDKTGVEIYEDDIVTKHPEYYRNGEIIYDEWNASLRFKADEDEDNLELTKYDCAKMEVIGNIHSNPELLNNTGEHIET